MKLLVMGAGYVGMALLKLLQSSGHEIHITTTQEDKVEALRAYGHVFLLHPTEDRGFKELVHICDGIVVLVAPKKGQDYETVYLHTAQRISSSLKDAKKNIYILYTSSTSVCEGVDSEWVTEDMILVPATENGKILLDTEHCFLKSGAEVCVLRLGGIYGPNRELPDRAKHFSGKKIQGTGNEPTNHIHLDDIVAAIRFCLDRRLTGIYHIVNDDHPTRKDLYSHLCKSMGIPPPIWNSDLAEEGRRVGYKVSNRKIKNGGFVFQKPFTRLL